MQDNTDVSNAHTPYDHHFYHVCYIREGTLVSSFGIAYALFPVSFTKIMLGVITFLPISYYIGTITMRADEFAERFHSVFIALFVLAVFILSYILDLLRKSNCWDNTCAESFFKTLKSELETLDGKHSAAEVRQSVFFTLRRIIIVFAFIRLLTMLRLTCMIMLLNGV